ncbi:Uma2 family endonuclease [Gemmata sp.]|uniref:Uma2 family endonuclease n=1 Tax=Gemmata sp. TaxID=1914242 RepID=UPI003F6FD6B6
MPTYITPRPLLVRWTAEQFNAVCGMGWFEGRRPFLLDGVMWEKGPMSPTYACTLGLVTDALRPLFSKSWLIRQQMPLTVDEYNDPVPDVGVVRGEPRDFSDEHPSTAVMVIEVADTSLQIDLTEKAERYATAGVADYWVLDVVNRELYVLRDPAPLPAGLGATADRDQKKFTTSDRVSPLAAPHASVLVGDLLP